MITLNHLKCEKIYVKFILVDESFHVIEMRNDDERIRNLQFFVCVVQGSGFEEVEMRTKINRIHLYNPKSEYEGKDE